METPGFLFFTRYPNLIGKITVLLQTNSSTEMSNAEPRRTRRKQKPYIIAFFIRMGKRWLEMVVVGGLLFNAWMMYTKAWDGTVGGTMIAALASFYATVMSAKKSKNIDEE